MPHHLGGVLGRVLVPCHIIRWVERRAGPEKIDHSPEAIDNHLIHSTITDGTCDLRTLGRITRIVPVVVRQVHIGRVAVLQDLLDTLVHSGPADRVVVHLSRLGRSQHERDTPHIPVNSLARERAEQVEMEPGPEAERASLLALSVNPVRLEINEITGIVADIVLQEKVQIVDGCVVIVPFGGERVVAHPCVTLRERSPRRCLRTVKSVICGGGKARAVSAVIDSREIIGVSLVHKASEQLRIVTEILVVVTSVRKRVKEGTSSSKNRRYRKTEYGIFDFHDLDCSLSVKSSV